MQDGDLRSSQDAIEGVPSEPAVKSQEIWTFSFTLRRSRGFHYQEANFWQQPAGDWVR